MSRSVVLLSGGLDSTVNLAAAREAGPVESALTFDYGQQAAAREIEAAAALAEHYFIAHRVIKTPWLSSDYSALTGAASPLPEPLEQELDGPEAADNAAAVWIPNRNGVFVNIAAALAEQVGADEVVVGFNAEEAATFPDNSADYVEAANAALDFSTQGRVKIVCYTLQMTKAEIVALGRRLGAPLRLVWACYRGEDVMCGRCESCRRLARAYEEAK